MIKRWLEIRWVQTLVMYLGITVATALLIVCALFAERLLLAWAIAIAGGMATTFILGLAFIRFVLSPGYPILGVARTLIDEAIRMKVALVLLLMLLFIVPFIPVMLDPNERLSYRLNTFITYAMMITSLFLSLMTIFLACGTVSNELRDKHVFMSLTKPIGRGQYLLGKWLGIVLLNLLLIFTVGGGIYQFAVTLGKLGRPVDEVDAAIVREEVLTARVSMLPEFPGDLERAVDAEIERRERELPHAFADMTPDEARMRVRQEIIMQWHAIAPINHQTYVFRNLQPIKERGGWMQLRLKPRQGSGTDMVHFRLRLNGYELRLPPVANDTFYRLPIQTDLINDKGELAVAIRNENPNDPRFTPAATLEFEPGEGLELLTQVGTFGPNLAKGFFVLWVRLCCLGMLGLAAATFLSFPIASMFTLLIYFTAASSGFISESLQTYAAFGFREDTLLIERIGLVIGELISQLASGDIGQVFKFVLKGIGTTFMALVPSFGELDPVPMVSDGRVVPDAMMWKALQVGVFWTGLAGVIGWLIFRRRELARVIV